MQKTPLITNYIQNSQLSEKIDQAPTQVSSQISQSLRVQNDKNIGKHHINKNNQFILKAYMEGSHKIMIQIDQYITQQHKIKSYFIQLCQQTFIPKLPFIFDKLSDFYEGCILEKSYRIERNGNLVLIIEVFIKKELVLKQYTMKLQPKYLTRQQQLQKVIEFLLGQVNFLKQKQKNIQQHITRKIKIEENLKIRKESNKISELQKQICQYQSRQEQFVNTQRQMKRQIDTLKQKVRKLQANNIKKSEIESNKIYPHSRVDVGWLFSKKK